MKRVLIMVLAGVFLLACRKFDVGEEQWPTYNDGPSKSEFQQFYVGRGWRWGSTHTIKNGRVTNEDYYSVRVGGSTLDYYFGEDELTVFLHPNYRPGAYYYTRPYEYREEDSSIYINGYKKMTIVGMSNNKDSFEVIDYLAIKSDGTKVFGLTRYYLMTDEELAQARDHYQTNLDTVEGR